MSFPDYVSRSSTKGRLWAQIVFKVKYCHNVFDFENIKADCELLLTEAARKGGIEVSTIGFDRNHVHLDVDIAIKSIPEIAKALKGYTAKRLFTKHKWLKARYFWGSGFWNPGTFFEGVGRYSKEQLDRYVRNQGLPKTQSTLGQYLN